MIFNKQISLSLTVTLLILFAACKHEPQQPVNKSGYPAQVAKIVETQCATAGCHNEASYQNAGSLRLDTWANMFNGGGNGASIVPFAPDNSPLLYFINTHAELGPVAQPTMPYNGTPLTQDQYLLIRDWVAAGAPDKDGNVAFSTEAATRQKIYMTMQGCDLLAVLDAKSRVVMRYIQLGKLPGIEAPHCVRVTKDGKYAYVSFLASQYVQKISTEEDKIVDEIFVGDGSWNVFHLSDDGRQMLLCDWSDNGKVLLVNLETKSTNPLLTNMSRPHGIASNAAFNTFYITSEGKNIIYKINTATSQIKEVSIGSGMTSPAVTHEIMMTPDETKYLITCQQRNEVRVMDAIADTLIKVIPVGVYPQEIAISYSQPYMFVTCMEDNTNYPGAKGSVYAVNYNTWEATRIEGPFYQPHAITVDDQNSTFYVVSRNVNPNGPAPHHSSSCSGRNGFYHVYDLNTFEKLPKRYEVTVEPYSADARFK